MQTLLDPFFWLGFVYFISTVFLAFFIPGDVILRPFGFGHGARISLAIIVGMVFWALQGFVFGFLGMRYFTYFYLLFFLFLWIKITPIKHSFAHIKHTLHAIDPISLFLIIVGTSIQLIMFFSIGVMTQQGMFFCCGVPDSLYHIALTNELVRQFPPHEPGMAGITVHNYHYFANIVVAELVRIFHLPLLATQAQYVTFLFSILLGTTALAFTTVYKLHKNVGRFLLFFLYFHGNILFLLWILTNGSRFYYTFSEDATTLWNSPPRFFAIIVFFAALCVFSVWIKKKSLYQGLIAAVLFASLIGFKVYIGFLALGGFAFLGLYFLLKRQFAMAALLILCALLSIGLYLPVNSGAGGLYYTGFWRFEDFLAHNQIGLSDWVLARKIFSEHNNYLRVTQYALMYVAVYMAALCGSFLLGLAQTRHTLKQLPISLHIVLLGGLLCSLTLGLLFQQKTGGANSSQFLFAVYIVGAIYASIACAHWIQKMPRVAKGIVILCIIILTIPRVVYDAQQALINQLRGNGLFVSHSELAALSYLRTQTQPSSLVLVDIKRRRLGDTGYYINFLANRPLFLVGEGILADHGAPIADREQVQNAVFQANDVSSISALLKKNHIDYVYLRSADVQQVPMWTQLPKNTTVYHNDEMRIIRLSY